MQVGNHAGESEPFVRLNSVLWYPWDDGRWQQAVRRINSTKSFRLHLRRVLDLEEALRDAVDAAVRVAVRSYSRGKESVDARRR